MSLVLNELSRDVIFFGAVFASKGHLLKNIFKPGRQSREDYACHGRYVTVALQEMVKKSIFL